MPPVLVCSRRAPVVVVVGVGGCAVTTVGFAGAGAGVDAVRFVSNGCIGAIGGGAAAISQVGIAGDAGGIAISAGAGSGAISNASAFIGGRSSDGASSKFASNFSSNAGAGFGVGAGISVAGVTGSFHMSAASATASVSKLKSPLSAGIDHS